MSAHVIDRASSARATLSSINDLLSVRRLPNESVPLFVTRLERVAHEARMGPFLPGFNPQQVRVVLDALLITLCLNHLGGTFAEDMCAAEAMNGWDDVRRLALT